MHIHKYEKIVLGLTIALLLTAATAIAVAAMSGHAHLPAPVGRVDPAKVRETAPFNQTGLRDLGGGQYEATMIARVWAFEPAEIRVPAGSTVTFTIASADVTHGLLIENTNVNLTIIPGQISRATAVFKQAGTYLMVCHEYCGASHHTMSGRVIVQ